MATMTPIMAAGLAATLAAGARGGSELWKYLAKPQAALPKSDPAVHTIPVPVSEEEAKELRRRGIRVKRAFNMSTGSFIGDAANAGAATLAAYGAWQGLDHLFDKSRKNKAKRRLEETRSELRKLLNEDEEALLAPAMNKVANMLTPIDRLVGAASPVPGWLIGGGGVALGLSKFHEWRDKSKAVKKMKALKKRLEQRETEQPVVELQPVVVG